MRSSLSSSSVRKKLPWRVAIFPPFNKFLKKEREREKYGSKSPNKKRSGFGPEYPSKFLSSLQSYCPRLSVGLLSYDSSSTLIRLDRWKIFGRALFQNVICVKRDLLNCHISLRSPVSLLQAFFSFFSEKMKNRNDIYVCMCIYLRLSIRVYAVTFFSLRTKKENGFWQWHLSVCLSAWITSNFFSCIRCMQSSIVFSFVCESERARARARVYLFCKDFYDNGLI